MGYCANAVCDFDPFTGQANELSRSDLDFVLGHLASKWQTMVDHSR